MGVGEGVGLHNFGLRGIRLQGLRLKGVVYCPPLLLPGSSMTAVTLMYWDKSVKKVKKNVLNNFWKKKFRKKILEKIF